MVQVLKSLYDVMPRNFLIDKENKVALLFSCNNVYIIGENDYLRRVDIGEFHPLARLCSLECSYDPSSLQIK